MLLWYQTALMASPSVQLRYLKAKELLFTIFSVDGSLRYVTMLLALCRDASSPATGLAKAVSVLTDRDVADDGARTNGPAVRLSAKLLYNVLAICLKNYMVSDR